MKREVECASRFFAQTLSLSDEQAETFASTLERELAPRFEGHWFPGRPHRGSAYRALRHTESWSDGALAAAVQAAGASVTALPTDLTVWVDPDEVSVRVGAHGSIFNLNLEGGGSAPASNYGYGGGDFSAAGGSPPSRTSSAGGGYGGGIAPHMMMAPGSGAGFPGAYPAGGPAMHSGYNMPSYGPGRHHHHSHHTHGSPDGSPRSLSPRTSPRISHALPILDAAPTM